MLAGLRKNYSTDFHKIRRKGGTWTKEETIRLGGNPDHVMLGLEFGLELWLRMTPLNSIYI